MSVFESAEVLSIYPNVCGVFKLFHYDLPTVDAAISEAPDLMIHEWKQYNLGITNHKMWLGTEEKRIDIDIFTRACTRTDTVVCVYSNNDNNSYLVDGNDLKDLGVFILLSIEHELNRFNTWSHNIPQLPALKNPDILGELYHKIMDDA